MTPPRNYCKDKSKDHIAAEAARIIVTEGVNDYLTAKQKAAERIGLNNIRSLPSNLQVEEALSEYLRIFKTESQETHLLKLRRAAVAMMEYLNDFKPTLAGSVLRGTVNFNSPIQLHVFSGSPEEVGIFLLQKNIPYELKEKHYTLSSGKSSYLPSYQFIADGINIEVTVFSNNGLAVPPQSEFGKQPMERASISTVKDLIRQQLDNNNKLSIQN